VMSAFGFLTAPAAFERMRADIALLDAIDPARASRILAELTEEATEFVRAAGVPPDECTVQQEAALRFAGQSYSLTVRLAANPLSVAGLRKLREDFVAAYRERYYRLNPDAPVELVNWRVSVTGPEPKLRIAPLDRKGRSVRKGARPVYFPDKDSFLDCPVYDRYAMAPGRRFRGPAVIEEPESTVVIGPGTTAMIDKNGNLVAMLPRAARRERAAA